MNNDKIVVLHIVNELDSGGVESMLYNYYTNLDKEKIQFDFIVFGEHVGSFEKKFLELGSNVYHVRNKKDGLLGCIKEVYDVLKSVKTDNTFIHVHRGLTSNIFLALSQMCGYKVRISHSHYYMNDMSGIKYKVLSKATSLFSTHYYACGIDAGRWLYGDKAYNQGKIDVIHNAINQSKYEFDEVIRSAKRKELGLEGKFIIGNVARFSYQKNHEFLIDVFYDVSKQDKDSVLLLIGNGEDEQKIREKVSNLNLDDRVIFLGVRNDIKDLLQAMDVFVLPSRFEGLPVVLVEAQTSRLACVVSENITKEIKITNEINYLNLSDDLGKWSSTILKYKDDTSNEKRLMNKVNNTNYDISVAAKSLESRYVNLLNK